MELPQSFRFHAKEQGQTLLIVVLVMVVLFTIALSVATRNATNERVSKEEVNAQQALSAAEAGIDRVLKTNTPIGIGTPVSLGNNTTIASATITQFSGTQFQLKGGNSLEKDAGFDVWLSDHNANGTLTAPLAGPATITFYWGSPGTSDCNNAAIELIVLSGATINAATSRRYAFDTPCSRGNGFSSSSSAVGDANAPRTYLYKASITVSNGWIVRLVPLYASTMAGIFSTVSLPQQGKLVTSVGQSANAQRKITAFQGFPQLADGFFSYILFCTKTGADATSCK